MTRRQGSVHGKSGEGGGRGRGYRSAGGCGYGRGCGGRREDGYSGGPLRQPSGVFVVAFVAEKKLYFTHMVLPFFGFLQFDPNIFFNLLISPLDFVPNF